MSPVGDARTIPDALAAAARRFADHEAVVDGEVRLTYADLHDRVRDCSRMFVAEGVRTGDRVAICAPNTHHWPEAALGALYAGATLVPINTRFTGPEILDILRRTRARAFVVAGPFLGTDRLSLLREAAAPGSRAAPAPVPGLPDLRTVLRVPVEGQLPADDTVLDWSDISVRGATVGDAELDARRAHVDPNIPSDILFTSGTTGRSKGAMSSHGQSLAVARAWAEVGGLSGSDRYLVINPFFHSFGYKAGLLAALQCGATLIPEMTFDVEATLRLIERERISVLPGAPTIYQMLLDHPTRAEHDLSSLRLAVTGAATVPVVLVERMRDELKFDVVLTAYGLTEAVVATMCRPEDPPEIIANTCGRATAGFEVRVADKDGTTLPPGEPGEVLLRGPNVMLGYLDDPEATAKAIDARGGTPASGSGGPPASKGVAGGGVAGGGGWLHTGDVGVLDQRGYLKITDRIKDMYVSGGFNVYPAEVEQALARLDGVSDSAVIGVPDQRLGEVGKAYVVRKTGHPLSEVEVVEHCKSLLANYKVPRVVEFVAELPRHATGKVLKRILRDRHDAMTKEQA